MNLRFIWAKKLFLITQFTILPKQLKLLWSSIGNVLESDLSLQSTHSTWTHLEDYALLQTAPEVKPLAPSLSGEMELYEAPVSFLKSL